MPRGRKKKDAAETTAAVTPEPGAEGAVAVMEPPRQEAQSAALAEPPSSPPTRATEEPPFTPTGEYTPTSAGPGEATPHGQAARGRFRSWTVDNERGYHRLTDDEQQRLVLTFDQKPPADVLTAIKGSGFQYHPDYHGQKNAWVRRNDFEGRVQVESLEKLVQELIPGREGPAR